MKEILRMNANLLALDLSTTKVGYSLWNYYQDRGLIRSGVFVSKEKNYFDRILKIRDAIHVLISSNLITAVSIEDYAFSRHSSSVTKLAELQGIIKAMLRDMNFTEGYGIRQQRYFTIPPTSWKKYCFNKGNLAKDQVMVKTLSKYGKEFEDNNEADAYCLGQASLGIMKYADRRILPKEMYAREAIIKLVGKLPTMEVIIDD